MKVEAKIFHKGEVSKYNAVGNYALENILFEIIEKYFGRDIRLRFENSIKAKKED